MLLSFIWHGLYWEALRRKIGETLLHKGKERRVPREGKVGANPGQSRWESSRSWQMTETIQDGRGRAAPRWLPMDDPPIICPRKLSRAKTVCTVTLLTQPFLGMFFGICLWGVSQAIPGCCQGPARAGSHPQRQSKCDCSVLESKGFYLQRFKLCKYASGQRLGLIYFI